MTPQREWFEKDYYAILGVNRDASDKDVTREYRKLAKKYHPDANPGDAGAEERFKEISAAYEVLGDAEKRKEYDQVRDMVASGATMGPGGFPGYEGGTFRYEGEGLGDLLSGLFGGGRGRRRAPGPTKGSDLAAELDLDFLDAVHGITTTLELNAEAVCSVCGGSGAEPGSHPDICPQCQGTGTIATDQGPFSFSQVCPTCNGRGLLVTDACKRCRGRGVEVRRREVKVKIPVGVKDGQRIRVAGRGAPGRNGGPAGDLYVVVHVRPHAFFGRSGARDLTVHVPVTFAEAALGSQVRVPTLGDAVTVKVPAGTQPGNTVKVRGKGIAPSRGQAGDLLVTFDVAVPKSLSKEQRAAVEALAKTLPEAPREHLDALPTNA
jgi:molecular chaperone DnaJ